MSITKKTISEINELLKDGAEIQEDGSIIFPAVEENTTVSETTEAAEDITVEETKETIETETIEESTVNEDANIEDVASVDASILSNTKDLHIVVVVAIICVSIIVIIYMLRKKQENTTLHEKEETDDDVTDDSEVK